MKNRNKTYAKVMVALAIGFSFAAEATNYALSQSRNNTEKQGTTKATKEGAKAGSYQQDKLFFWE